MTLSSEATAHHDVPVTTSEQEIDVAGATNTLKAWHDLLKSTHQQLRERGIELFTKVKSERLTALFQRLENDSPEQPRILIRDTMASLRLMTQSLLVEMQIIGQGVTRLASDGDIDTKLALLEQTPFDTVESDIRKRLSQAQKKHDVAIRAKLLLDDRRTEIFGNLAIKFDELEKYVAGPTKNDLLKKLTPMQDASLKYMAAVSQNSEALKQTAESVVKLQAELTEYQDRKKGRARKLLNAVKQHDGLSALLQASMPLRQLASLEVTDDFLAHGASILNSDKLDSTKVPAWDVAGHVDSEIYESTATSAQDLVQQVTPSTNAPEASTPIKPKQPSSPRNIFRAPAIDPQLLAIESAINMLHTSAILITSTLTSPWNNGTVMLDSVQLRKLDEQIQQLSVEVIELGDTKSPTESPEVSEFIDKITDAATSYLHQLITLRMLQTQQLPTLQSEITLPNRTPGLDELKLQCQAFETYMSVKRTSAFKLWAQSTWAKCQSFFQRWFNSPDKASTQHTAQEVTATEQRTTPEDYLLSSLSMTSMNRRPSHEATTSEGSRHSQSSVSLTSGL